MHGTICVSCTLAVGRCVVAPATNGLHRTKVVELASHRETAASPLPTLPSWSLSIAKSTQEFQRLDVKPTCQRHCV